MCKCKSFPDMESCQTTTTTTPAPIVGLDDCRQPNNWVEGKGWDYVKTLKDDAGNNCTSTTTPSPWIAQMCDDGPNMGDFAGDRYSSIQHLQQDAP